uniref:Reverse transcriptase domain-containing protein n=2 Tax=Graphocephala atropunctata TaxID=36148 RepID=A0A1B6LBV2_9HEMI
MLMKREFLMDAQEFFLNLRRIVVNKIDFFSTLKKRLPKIKKKTCYNEWYTRDLAAMKKRLLFLDSLVKNTDCDRLKKEYVDSKQSYKQSIKKAKLAFNATKIEGSKNKCKTAWQLIKDDINNPSPRLVEVTPDSFNHYFVNSVTLIKESIVKPNIDSVSLIKNNPVRKSTFNFIKVTVSDMTKAIKRLKNSDSVDVFKLSNNIFKLISHTFIIPLTVCINKCLTEGYFPDELKLSRICPVYKKGPKNIPESYRPISIIPVFSKVIEIIVHDQLISYLECNGYLNISQFGFRKGKCTTDAIDALVRQILDSFENKASAQATFCDLSKAFDCVDHKELIAKLNYYGVNGIPLKFFQSYLSNRRQKVSINGNWSNEIEVRTGVPQGSVLGPLLFLVQVNDLPSSVGAKYILYADDTTFLNVHSDFDSLKNLVNSTVEEASTWFRANGFLLNESKTKNIIFSLKQKPLNNPSQNICTTVKFLGIHIDDNLTWNSHIEFISKRLCRVIFLLRRILYCVPEDYVRSLYFAFFQSIIKYGLVIWGNSSNIKDILILQKKAIRVMSKVEPLEHCKPLFIKLKIQTVINLYIYDSVVFTLKNLQSLIFSSDLHGYNTRNKNKIAIEHCRLTKTQHSHLVISQKIFNKLSNLSNKYPEKIFLIKFYDWLLENPFYALSEFLDLPERRICF